MTWYYDIYGWISETPIPDRSTELPPPGPEDIPPGYKLNWTGTQWIALQYTEPPPQHPQERKIPKVNFKMRIPPQKYGKLKDLAETNSTVWAFIDVLNDPTLTEIDLASEYLTKALQFLKTIMPDDISDEDIENWLA